MKSWIRSLNNHKFKGGVHSQLYQDELIDIIFENVHPVNSKPFMLSLGSTQKA